MDRFELQTEYGSYQEGTGIFNNLLFFLLFSSFILKTGKK